MKVSIIRIANLVSCRKPLYSSPVIKQALIKEVRNLHGVTPSRKLI